MSSSNFSTLGKISGVNFEELISKFPEIKNLMIDRVKDYDDNLKIFFEKALTSIDYMQGIPEDAMNEMIFSFTPEQLEKGQIIFEVGDEANEMFIIQNGMVEIYTTMENGVDFVIERLYRGSVMNHRSFLLLDRIDVAARCATPVSLYYIGLPKILGKVYLLNFLRTQIKMY